MLGNIKQRPGSNGGGNNVGMRAMVGCRINIPVIIRLASTTGRSRCLLGRIRLPGSSALTVSHNCISVTRFRHLARRNIYCIAGVGGGLGCRRLRSVACIGPRKLIARVSGGILFAEKRLARRTHVIRVFCRAGGPIILLAGGFRFAFRSVSRVCHLE